MVQRINVDGRYFAEGLTDWGDRLMQLTWDDQHRLRLRPRVVQAAAATFTYTGEGWGLTHDDAPADHERRHADAALSRSRDVAGDRAASSVRTAARRSTISTSSSSSKGEVYANVWLTDRIAIIAPDIGRVDRLDRPRRLMPRGRSGAGDAVLNGIAYDAARDRLFVTGKAGRSCSRFECGAHEQAQRDIGRPVTIRAHAKINLDLRVLGTRPDGFHELRTVFQAIALHDTIECVPREGPFAIECDAAGVPLDRGEPGVARGGGAVALAAAARAGRATCSSGWTSAFRCRRGLGGGSADAAATLLALARAWRVPVRPNQLTDVAATLGADVPFFLSGGTALGLGRGDEVYPLADLPRHWIVLLVPGFGVSTPTPMAGTTPSATGRGPASASRSTCPGRGRRARRR